MIAFRPGRYVVIVAEKAKVRSTVLSQRDRNMVHSFVRKVWWPRVMIQSIRGYRVRMIGYNRSGGSRRLDLATLVCRSCRSFDDMYSRPEGTSMGMTGAILMCIPLSIWVTACDQSTSLSVCFAMAQSKLEVVCLSEARVSDPLRHIHLCLHSTSHPYLYLAP